MLCPNQLEFLVAELNLGVLRDPHCSSYSGTVITFPIVDPTFRWTVEIIQDGHTITNQDGQFKIRKMPFTIRVWLPHLLGVSLAVLDDYQIFERTTVGYDVANCVPMVDCDTPYPLCDATLLAEYLFNKEEDLTIEDTAHHYLYYEDELQHNLSHVKIANDGYTFERKVSIFALDPQPSISGTSYRPSTGGTIQGQTLYLIFFADYKNQGMIDAGS